MSSYYPLVLTSNCHFCFGFEICCNIECVRGEKRFVHLWKLTLEFPIFLPPQTNNYSITEEVCFYGVYREMILDSVAPSLIISLGGYRQPTANGVGPYNKVK